MASSENLTPAVIKRLSKEFATLTTAPPEGIKVIVNPDNLTDVQAWIQGPEGTPYEGGTFRVRLSLGADFPNVPPHGTFLTKIFHPNVSKSGDICVNVLKKEWKKEYGIAHILLTIKCLLIDPNPESALNEEAGRLLLENYNAYAKHARLMTSIHGTSNRQNGSFASPSNTTTITSKQQENISLPSTTTSASEKLSSPPISTATRGGNVAEAAEVLGVSNANGPTSPKKRVADKKPEKTDKKRTLRRL
ncbi:hypothetical protein PhCBS80983_g03459 [Powellomyces hirtus]|uniref:E2 ubiquitin-conjugating enzyme n=1 Tax=Powellomyces hirtus TaxID=109895 RepID=A0A507E1K6_9FUNG|nr:hypothetical protein PhCBS80983_g03459 [Powellomyces hirtus]